MNIDQLIRDADPAADFMIPGDDSQLARESFERRLAAAPARRQHAGPLRLTLPATLAAAASIAVAITLIFTITPGVPVSPAVAAVLNQAAAAAGRAKPLVLHAGQYLYTKTQSLSDGSWSTRGHIFYPQYVYTDQTWLTVRGAGKGIMTVNSPVSFAHGSRAAWIAAGRPRLFSHDPDKPFVSTGTGVPLDNLSLLPTDPAVLADAIQDGKTGLADVNADVEDPSTPGGTFYAAMLILSDQSVGGAPALRSALFKVMAEQPGIKLLGRTKTRSGRTGVALLTPPLGHNGTDVFKVIIDPRNGQILEYDEYARAGGADEQWTEFLSTAVVDKIGQLAHS
jgi:hypothetical protein